MTKRGSSIGWPWPRVTRTDDPKRGLLDARGTVEDDADSARRQLLYEHIGAYSSAADLDRDIRRYALEATRIRH